MRCRLIGLMLAVVPALMCVLIATRSMGEELPHGKWWRMGRAAEQLGLSDGERRELDDLFVQNRRTLIELKSALEKERFELDNLIERPSFDRAASMAQFKKLERARADLAAERFRFLLEVRNILGFERYQQLKSWFREFRENRRQGPNRGRRH